MSAPLNTAPQPQQGLTYRQALELAAAAIAAQKAAGAAGDAAAVTAASAEAIIAARERAAEHAKQVIAKLWATVNPYNPEAVAEFSKRAARVMNTAQMAATRAAVVAQTQQLAAVGVKAAPTQAVPVDVRAPTAVVRGGKLRLDHGTSKVDYSEGTANVQAAEMTTQRIFERPAAVYRYVQSEGGTDAAEKSGQRLDDLIEANLMLAQRLAQQQVIANAAASAPARRATPTDLDTPPGKARRAKIIGYRRVIHPELSRGGTCGMCIAAADRLYKVSELMPIHAHCKCTVAAVTEDHDPADEANSVDLNRLYKDARGTSVAHLKRTRYQVDEHGELGPVLVPAKKYKPRTTASKKRAGNAAVTDANPESKADVAARHLPLLEKSLADLRARGLAEDSRPVTYHKETIARLRGDLERGGGAESETGKAAQAKAPKTATGGGTGRPPTKPPSGGQSVQGADEPRRGKIDRSQVPHVIQHELDTAERLADLGEDVTFIPRGSDPRPDARLSDGNSYEFKSPTGASRKTALDRIKRESKDGKQYFVLDLARSAMSVEDAIDLAQFAVDNYPDVQQVWVIGKDTPSGPLNARIRKGGE